MSVSQAVTAHRTRYVSDAAHHKLQQHDGQVTEAQTSQARTPLTANVRRLT